MKAIKVKQVKIVSPKVEKESKKEAMMELMMPKMPKVKSITVSKTIIAKPTKTPKISEPSKLKSPKSITVKKPKY